MMDFLRKELPILLVIFMLSFTVRAPFFNKPLSPNYEWITAHVLLTMDIWEARGIANCHYASNFTYPNATDKWISDMTGLVPDSEGNYYYVSYSAVTFIVPYYLFKIFGIPIGILSLQLFNIVLHLISAFGVFWILKLLPQKIPNKSIISMPLIGYIAYLFIPATLWFHSSVYFADMLVQPVFIWAVFIVLKLFKSEFRTKSKILAIGLIILVFLMSFTEYIGVFFAITTACFLLFTRPRQPILALFLLLFSASAIFLMVAHYSSFLGFEKYLQAMLHRYAVRSGFSGASENAQFNNSDTYLHLFTYFIKFWLPAVALLGLFITLTIKKYSGKLRKVFSKDEKILTYYALVPCLLHVIVFFNFTAEHSFAFLKFTFPISIILALLFEKNREIFHVKLWLKRIVLALVVLFIISEAGYFWKERLADKTNGYKSLSDKILETASVDYVLFTEHYMISPPLVYYTKRNFKLCPNVEEAQKFLREHGNRKGIYYSIDGFEITKIEEVVP